MKIEDMKVKDIMTVPVLAVSPDDSVGKVAGILFENKIHAVPVVAKKKIVGIITEGDFFTRNKNNIFLPSYIEFVKRFEALKLLSDRERDKISKIVNLKAKDIMSKDCVSILKTMSLKDLLGFFRETKLTTLPVINYKDQLAGIVSIVDLIGFLKI